MKDYKRASDRCTRNKMRSPGRPPAWQRENFRCFWQAIALGRSSEEAALDAGVSMPLGPRWFRDAGGMAPTHLSPSAAPPSGRYLSFGEPRTSRSSLPGRQGYAPSPASLVVRLARSCGKYGATPRREVAGLTTGLAQPTGTQIAQPGELGPASWRSMPPCANTWRSALPGR